jgi:hypothetical protein
MASRQGIEAHTAKLAAEVKARHRSMICGVSIICGVSMICGVVPWCQSTRAGGL